MLLRKAQGGATVASHTWEKDGAVVDVPAELADELLAIPGGDFSVAEKEPVTEPAPAAKKAVTEPAPKRSPAKKPVAENS